MLSKGKLMICLIFCSQSFFVIALDGNERLVDPVCLAEFFHQYCREMGQSEVIIYGEFRLGGWWASHLTGHLPRIIRDLSRNDISSSLIDLSFHGLQKLPEKAMPPGGSEILNIALYDGVSTITSFLKRSSDLRLFRSRFNWLILTPENKKEDLEELFQQMGIYIDCNLRYGILQDSNMMKIWEVYHVSLNRPLRITHFGDWNAPIIINKNLSESIISTFDSKKKIRNWHLIIIPLPYKYIKRTSLEGIKIRAVTVGIRQYLTNFHRNPSGILEVTGGLFGEVFRTFEESINFTYTLKYIPGYAYGKIKELGNNWTGVVGHLASKRADIAICGISQSKWRSSVVDLTTPLIFLNSRLFIYGSPSPYKFDLYLRPFTGCLWMLLVVWFFLLALLQRILKLAYGIVEMEDENMARKKNKEKHSDLIHSLCKTLDKGSTIGETSASTRLLILSGSILFTVASTGYAAKLTSIQAIHRFQPSVENIYDLSKAHDWGMGVLNGSWDRWLMKNAPPNSTMGILWREKIKKYPSNLFKYPQEGLLKVSQKQRFAYLGDSLECKLMLAGQKVGAIEDDLEEKQGDVFKLSSNTEEEDILPPSVACNVAELPEDVVKIGTSFGLQKYSPIKDLFNYHLMKLWSVGVMRNLRKRYVEPPAKLCDTRSVFHPASIGDTFFSFILFGGGILLSLLIFVVELRVDSFHKNHETNKIKEKHPCYNMYIE